MPVLLKDLELFTQFWDVNDYKNMGYSLGRMSAELAFNKARW